MIEWNSVIFADDIKTLEENNITIDENNYEIHVNENNKNIKSEDAKDDGWTVVTSKKNNVIQKQLLQTMGFLPKKKNSNHKNIDSDKKENPDKNVDLSIFKK